MDPFGCSPFSSTQADEEAEEEEKPKKGGKKDKKSAKASVFAALGGGDSDEEAEEEEKPKKGGKKDKKPAKASVFAALGGGDSDEEAEEEQEEEKPKADKKKKKKASVFAALAGEASWREPGMGDTWLILLAGDELCVATSCRINRPRLVLMTIPSRNRGQPPFEPPLGFMPLQGRQPTLTFTFTQDDEEEEQAEKPAAPAKPAPAKKDEGKGKKGGKKGEEEDLDALFAELGIEPAPTSGACGCFGGPGGWLAGDELCVATSCRINRPRLVLMTIPSRNRGHVQPILF